MSSKRRFAFVLAGLGLATSGCAVQTGDEAVADGPGGEVEASTQALEQPRLLALGDSIAFGYNPFLSFQKDKAFAGYPEVLDGDYAVKNAACPGESSASFLSNVAPDNGCRAYKAAYPLHVNYHADETQMEFALRRLADENGPPDIITLNLGGNDIFLLQAECAANPTDLDMDGDIDATDLSICFAQGAPAMITNLATNVAVILGTLRGAGYQGQLVFQNLYSSSPSTDAFVASLNAAVGSVLPGFGAIEADAFGAFNAVRGAGEACAAGLLIPDPQVPGTCDVHPTQLGDDALAQSVYDVL